MSNVIEPSQSSSSNSANSKEQNNKGLGLFDGLHMNTHASSSLGFDKTPKLSNIHDCKILEYSKAEEMPPVPILVQGANPPQIQSSGFCGDKDSVVEKSTMISSTEDSIVDDNRLIIVSAADNSSSLEKDDREITSQVKRTSDNDKNEMDKAIDAPGLTYNVVTMSAEDEQALNDAFSSPTVSDQQIKAQHRSPETFEDTLKSSHGQAQHQDGQLCVHPGTSVPSPDVCLTILRRFALKTQSKIPKIHGGTRSKSIWQYVVIPNETIVKEDEKIFRPYGDMIRVLFNDNLDDLNTGHNGNSIAAISDPIQKVEQSVFSKELQTKADLAMSLFVHLFNIWGHASSSVFENRDKKSTQTFQELQAAIFDSASSLVSYGCLDNVLIQLVPESSRQADAPPCAQLFAQSVFNSDLSVGCSELAAIKFLLVAVCHTPTSGKDDSLLRGTYLLQSIRTLYHIYLTTDAAANKLAARAALQQIVTSVFTRAVRTTVPATTPHLHQEFPNENLRDSYLVLRSICKLSMRHIPESSRSGDNGFVTFSHYGIQTSASNEAWDGERLRSGSDVKLGGNNDGHDRDRSSGREMAQLLYTSALHPALESKLLALELILYVLQSVNFSTNRFIQDCGSQFHSAIRNYLCVSLLKNCTADNTKVVSLSLQIFVPTVRHFRTVLKTEIEAFVTNVFFVILESKDSPAEHKRLVVNTFQEICSDPSTLAEIFLNYDCDLSAVDLFHRIVTTLSKLARSGYNLQDKSIKNISSGVIGGLLLSQDGPSEAHLEKLRSDARSLRLNSMRALRQILASLHASIVEPLQQGHGNFETYQSSVVLSNEKEAEISTRSVKDSDTVPSTNDCVDKQPSLVAIYGSKKKRRAEELEAILRFSQKPSAGISYLAKCGHLDDKDPAEVARYLLKNKDELDKTMVGEYLGREPEYQNGFSIAVLHEYVRLLDFAGLVFDDAIRFYLSGFRLPGEAQKIDRIMEKFAERYTEQNPTVFPTADVAFILSFSIIMLNTDLHNPAIKEERRMTKEGFIRNNRGICDGGDLPEELLSSIFDRIKSNPISLKEDDEAREKLTGETKKSLIGLPSAFSPASFFTSYYANLDRARARENNFQKERDHIVRTTESLLKRHRQTQATNHAHDNSVVHKSRPSKSRNNSRFVLSGDSGLRDEYVSPMFDVTWGPALAAFSTALESANGTTMGALLSIASDEELEHAAENAAQTIEVCLTGFRFAICTAGLCGNSVARDAYMLALSRFSQLGTGVLLEPRHIRCVQTMLSLAREDGELLGGAWEHVFKALSEINRYHQLFHLMARNDRAAARAAERRRMLMEENQKRKSEKLLNQNTSMDSEHSGNDESSDESLDNSEPDNESLSEVGTDSDDGFSLVYDEEAMDSKTIDENNAREIFASISESTIEAIYERSSSLSALAVKEFVLHLCQVSQMEISVSKNVPLDADLNQVAYRHKHALLDCTAENFHHTQPNIYNLQKLVEVTHYNMASRPRLLFADIWVTVADHLTNVALHSNTAVAMFAVDAFRQLSIQYLKREELEVFEFQKRFLKPLVTVMARSEQPITKELLLNCVDHIVHVFNVDGSVTEQRRDKCGLRSGWLPILNILGLGGQDVDATVAKTSFRILSNEIDTCLQGQSHSDVLLSDHFVETVQAVLMFLTGPHDSLSVMAIDQVAALASFLALERYHGKKRLLESAENLKTEASSQLYSDNLELWWPILLGLSQATGDERFEIRLKASETLFGLIHNHFFKSEPKKSVDTTLQTLQLIFRGILAPILEYAEISSAHGVSIPSLPEDFEFITDIFDDVNQRSSTSCGDSELLSWLDTTFDTFMDSCITICLRSITEFNSTMLIEEIFAIFNSCLLSDSGALSVRGLRRLEQFVTSDLELSYLNDDVWATVSHMLRRCLSVRGFPVKTIGTRLEMPENESNQSDTSHNQDIQEFIKEDQMLSDRRYVGSNAAMVVGHLLSSSVFQVSLRWRLFLTAGLGRGIIEWERVASIIATPNVTLNNVNRPPDYRETALYGRKWMNHLLLQLASVKEIVEAPLDADPKINKFVTGQKLVADLTQGMLISFVEKERLASKYRNSTVDKFIYLRITSLVKELLTGLGNMDIVHLRRMSWISPILLSSCIQSKNEEIRLMVQELVGHISSSKDPPGKKYATSTNPSSSSDFTTSQVQADTTKP